MAPATRRKIWWVAGAFVVYEVIRLAVGLIAGSVAWANLSSLGNDGMNQTSQVAEGRLQTAGSAAGIAHAALQDPLYWALGALPHVGEDLKLANLATDATARSAGHLAEVFGNIPANQNLSELGLSSFAAKDVYHSLEALEKVAKDIAPQMGALNTTQLDFGMGPKVEKALPAIRALSLIHI